MNTKDVLVHSDSRFVVAVGITCLFTIVLWLLTISLVVFYGIPGLVINFAVTAIGGFICFSYIDKKLWKIHRDILNKHGL